MRRLLSLCAILLILGPPLYRVGRDPTDVFAQPLALPPTHLVHLAAWLLTAALLVPVASWNAPEVLRTLTRRPLLPYTAFVSVALFSVAYADAKLYAGFEATKLAVSLLLGVALVYVVGLGPHRGLIIVEAASALGAATELVLLFVAPSLVGVLDTASGVYRLTGGVFGDYGGFAVVTGLACLRRIPHASRGFARTWYRLGYAASWFLVGLSRTRTAIAAAILGAALTLWIGRVLSARARALWWIALASLGAMALGWGDDVAAFVRRGQSWPEIASLTGRVPAFRYLLGYWRESPLLGLGYASGTRQALLGFMKSTGMDIGQAHDVLSRSLVDLGLVGALLALLSVSAAAGASWRVARLARAGRVDRSLAAGWVGVIVWQLAWSVTGSGIAAPSVAFALGLAALQFLGWPASAVAFPAPSRAAAGFRR